MNKIITNWLAGLTRPVFYFVFFSLAAMIVAVSLFYYVSAEAYTPQVLGVQVSADANSLFGPGVRLVKTADNPQVYAIVNNRLRHLIRNEEVFYSYEFSFRNVQVVSQTELNGYAPAILAKEAGTGRVYYLSYGKGRKKYHPSPQAFAAYPANSWGNVVEMSQKDLSFWPEARLLKATDDPKVYFVDGGRKAWVPSESEFRNAGFNWHEIVTVFPGDLATYATIDYSVDLVRGTTPPPGQDTTPPAAAGDGQLVVSLAAQTPAARLLPLTTARNTVSIIKLQAVWGAVQINSVTLTKRGLSGREGIARITIEDENGTVYGTANGTNSDGKATVRFGSRVLLVPRDGEKQLVVKVDVAAAARHDTTISLGIATPADISANAPVGGIFPAFGAEHKFVATQGSIGVVSIESKVINAGGRDVNIGVKKEVVAEFSLRETSGSEDVALAQLSLFNDASARDDDIDYIYLYKDGRQIAATKYLVNGVASFDFSREPIVIKKNSEVKLAVRVDIAKGEGSSLKIVIAKPLDVVLEGLTQHFNISPAAAEGFPVGRGANASVNRVTFRLEGIGLFATSRDDDEREVRRAAAGALFGEFELRGVSGEIFLQRLQVQLQKENQAPNLERDLVVYDATNKREVVRIDRSRLTSGESVNVGLDGYPVAAGARVKFQFLADVPETAASNNIYRVIIAELTYKVGTSNTEYANGTVVRGQTMRVVAPTLTVMPATFKNNVVTPSGDDDPISLSGFNLKASSDERIRVTSVTVNLAPGSQDVTFTNGFSDMALYRGSRRVSEVVARPNSTTYTFTNINISISANRAIDLFVKAITQSVAASTTVRFRLEDATAEGYSSKAPALVTGEGTLSEAITLTAP